MADRIWIAAALVIGGLGVSYQFLGFRVLDWLQARADRRECRRLGLPVNPSSLP